MHTASEVNFDGLVGPTHNYAGLSFGNLASVKHRNVLSSPKQAALQGLAKMKFLADLGVRQAVLPPQERPDLRTLRRVGFSGSDAQVLDQARRGAPLLLAACCSASGMWAANAATVSPAADVSDGRLHFTPANLVTQFHRSLEAQTTANILRAIFRDDSVFAHHAPLPAGVHFGDEGAANHMRMARSHSDAGIEIFVYGRSVFDLSRPAPGRFPARQTREACEALARLHQLDRDRTVFVQQTPAAIDAGAFHNDVVAVANENMLLYHAAAFLDREAAIAEIRRKFESLAGEAPVVIEVTDEQVPLEDAVRSYLFNSQLVRLPDRTMAMICPTECRETSSTVHWLERLMGMNTAIKAVHFVDVRQSMNNGGGPACLRLRVVLDDSQLAKTAPAVFLDDARYQQLVAWVERHYRERLAPNDLADPKLVQESRTALDELTSLLGLGAIYGFQREREGSADR